MSFHYETRDNRTTKTKVLDRMNRLPSLYRIQNGMTEDEKLAVWKERWNILKEYVKKLEDK